MKKNIKILIKFLGIAWHIRPSFILLLLVNSLVSSGRIFANVILPKYLIDSLMNGGGGAAAFYFAGAIVAANGLFFFLEKLLKYGLTVSREYITKGIHGRLADKVMSVEYRHLENPYYLDLKERAIFAVENQSAIENVVQYTTDAMRLLFVIIGLAGIMCQLSVVLLIVFFVCIAVMMLIQARFTGEQIKFFDRLIPLNRRFGYYYSVSSENKCQKDIRLYDMSGMIGDKVTTFIVKTIVEFKSFLVKMGFATSLTHAMSIFQNAFAYAYVGIRCISDKFGPRISIGSLTMYVSSAMQFSEAVMGLGSAFINMRGMLGYLEPFMELLELPDEKVLTGDVKVGKNVPSIRFENVSFAYPKTDKKVLDGVSFTINAGEKISIVGLNGAGKTTLVKLICRLYHPDSGKIYLNDIDIFEYDYESYLSAISAVFQDFKLFNFSIQENITCKGIDEDTEGAVAAAVSTGIMEKINEFPNGIKTLMGKDYDKDGVQLSGGQSQKIAIARALYKAAGLVILDEPTSALDPIAEAGIYEQFNNLVGDKTAIYISHRMSSSVFCDKVLILDGGKVCDFAPHEELLEKKDSLYYKMFMAQAENYQM